jgi:hypothetical protein
MTKDGNPPATRTGTLRHEAVDMESCRRRLTWALWRLGSSLSRMAGAASVERRSRFAKPGTAYSPLISAVKS